MRSDDKREVFISPAAGIRDTRRNFWIANCHQSEIRVKHPTEWQGIKPGRGVFERPKALHEAGDATLVLGRRQIARMQALSRSAISVVT